jgi:neurotransmitter:Na+ symporter, NSS family
MIMLGNCKLEKNGLWGYCRPVMREEWKSRWGFVLAAAGSAVGLINIWRFPYVVGQYGGAAFLAVYLLCLLLIGLPVFISELAVGRSARATPSGAFRQLGGTQGWGRVGRSIVLTGFLVSAFYSVVAGWVIGYLVEILRDGLGGFGGLAQSVARFDALVGSASWTLLFHTVFLGLSSLVLLLGVKRGIEWGNRWLMPMLLLLLVLLCIKGLSLPGASGGLRFFWTPDWSKITPAAILVALGHSFFTLSLGQGTMVTYGSYLDRRANLLACTVPVVLFDTVISMLAGVAILTVVFAAGMEPTSGPALLFHALPLVFGQMAGGTLFAILFFLLVGIAALTSEISALEPPVAYLMETRGWSRRRAVATCGIGAWLIGIPCALSFNLLRHWTLGGATLFDCLSWTVTNVMIPLGGLAAALLVGWRWGFSRFFRHLLEGAVHWFRRMRWLRGYLWLGVKITAPILILIVLVSGMLI